MKVFFAGDDAETASRMDNTLEVVVIPVRTRNDLGRLRRASAAAPRAAIVAVSAPALAVDVAKAGAHARVDEGSSASELEAAIAVGRARKDAEDARGARHDEAIGAFGHEVRNPLNVITMTTAFLSEAHDVSAERRVMHFEKVDRAVQRITTLLDQLAEVVRHDAGRAVLDVEEVLAADMARAALEAAAPVIEQRRLGVALRADETARMIVDRPHMLRAIAAVVETIALGARAGTELSLEVRAEGEWLAFSAACRAAVPGVPPPPPTLALCLAARVVEAHGGHAWAERTDAGVLGFRLPRAP
jgi:signal transduction histidine kinase